MSTPTYAQVLTTYRTFRFVHGIRESVALTATAHKIERLKVCEILNLDPKYCTSEIHITMHVVVYSTLDSIVKAVEERMRPQWGEPADIQVTPTRTFLIYEVAVDPRVKPTGS